MAIKRIGILTSGGDAPGMNAAIRSSVRYALYYNIEPVAIIRGYAGLINDEIEPLTHRSVSGIINRGGTIIKTARCPEFLARKGQAQAIKTLKKHQIDGLILIGGDGTYRGGIQLHKHWGIPCIGVPGTIDNDLSGTDETIGSDTAVNTALDAIDKVRDTATSMERIFVIEVMGHTSGYIALNVALAGGTEEVIIPEQKWDFSAMCHEIVNGNIRGKISWIIVTAEGAAKGNDIASRITELTSLETRVVVLGHVQRGGIPTARDRILASRLGAEAVRLLIKGVSGKAVGMSADKITVVDFETAVKKKKFESRQAYSLIKILT